jgi:hypothetical protein
MATVASSEGLSVGAMNNNALKISMLQSSLSGLNSDLSTTPTLIKTIIEGECWRTFKFPEKPIIRWNAADFRRFVEAKRPEGCETPLHVLEKALQGTDAWELFDDLTRGEQGSGPGGNNPLGLGGKSHKTIDDRDNITVINHDPSIIPFSPSVPEPRVRDYDREAPTGTSVSYALRRLKTQRPDLHEKVQAKELSPNAAMVEAGFRKPSITLPIDPEAAVRLVVKHFKGEVLEALIDGLVNWSGYTPNSRTEHDPR